MKKLVSILAIALVFAVSAQAAREPIVENEKISEVITNYYPNIAEYYGEGLIKVDALTEDTLADGSTEYNIKYHFTRYQYTGEELNQVLKEKYQDIYRLKLFGIVKDVAVIKYVDKETGIIIEHVYYNRARQPRHRFHRG